MDSHLSDHTRLTLIDLGFEPLSYDDQVEAWRADRGGAPIAAFLFCSREKPTVLNLSGGPRESIDAPLRVHSIRAEVGPMPVLKTGDAVFDERFLVTMESGDAETMPTMLHDGVRSAICELPVEVRPSITGTSVNIHIPLGDPAAESALLRQCVPILDGLGAALGEGARGLPVPRLLREFAPEFERAALAEAMTFRRNTLSASGTFGQATAAVSWRSAKEKWVPALPAVPTPGYTVSVKTSRPLPGAPLVRPAGAAAGLLKAVGLGGLRTGDADFDREWVISAKPPEAAQALLRPPVRDALSQLSAAGLRVELNEWGLIGHANLPTSPATVPALLPILTALARALDAQFPAAPYR